MDISIRSNYIDGVIVI